MKKERIKDLEGRGYTVIGETENFETLLANNFGGDVIMLMSVHDDYYSSVRLNKKIINKLCKLAFE